MTKSRIQTSMSEGRRALMAFSATGFEIAARTGFRYNREAAELECRLSTIVFARVSDKCVRVR